MQKKYLLENATKNLGILFESTKGALEGIEKEMHLQEISEEWNYKRDFCDMWLAHTKEILEDVRCLQNLCKVYANKD